MDPINLEVEKQRVSLLLLINSILVQKSIQVQQQINVGQQGTPYNPKLPELLQQLLKRLHANLTCIGELSERQSKTQNQQRSIFPGILAPIPEFFELTELYNHLRSLFPEAAGVTNSQIRIRGDDPINRAAFVPGQPPHQQSPLSQPPIQHNQFQPKPQPTSHLQQMNQRPQPTPPSTSQPQHQHQHQHTMGMPQFSPQQSLIQDHFERQQQLQHQHQHQYQHQQQHQASPQAMTPHFQQQQHMMTPQTPYLNVPPSSYQIHPQQQPPQQQQQTFW